MLEEFDTSSSRTIIITGSNKGIGFHTLQRLMTRNPSFRFIMAVRTKENGESAIQELTKTTSDASSKIDVLELDVSNSSSIDKFVEKISSKYT